MATDHESGSLGANFRFPEKTSNDSVVLGVQNVTPPSKETFKNQSGSESRPLVKSGHDLIDFLSKHWQLVTTILALIVSIATAGISFTAKYIYEPWKKENNERLEKIEKLITSKTEASLKALEVSKKETDQRFEALQKTLTTHSEAIDMHITSYAIFKATLDRNNQKPSPEIDGLTFSNGEPVK